MWLWEFMYIQFENIFSGPFYNYTFISDEVEYHPTAMLFSLGFMSTYCSWSCAYRHRQDKSKRCSACGQRKDRATSKSNDKCNFMEGILTEILLICISYKIGHLETIFEIALKRV